MRDKISVLVVDDEEISREYVVELVGQDSRFLVVGTSCDGEQALEDFERYRPDAVFIDLEMPRLHGFDFCQKIDVNSTALVFVTAHGSQALTAFDFQAVDFVTKPIQTDRFTKTLQRVYDHTSLRSALQNGDTSGDVLNDTPDRRVIHTTRGSLFFSPREIQLIESSGNYIRVWIRNNPYLVRDTFQRFCASLESSDITIVHRRYAVNIQHVRRVTLVNRPGGAELDIIGIEKSIPISRSRRAVVMEMVESLQQSE